MRAKRPNTESTPMSFNGEKNRRVPYPVVDDDSLIDWDQSSAEMQKLKQINANITNKT